MAEFDNQRTVVIACPNAEFIRKREEKLLHLIDGKAELHIITDKNLFIDYFSEQESIDVLLIDRSFYEPYIEAQDIRSMILLEDEIVSFSENEDESNHRRILKELSEDDFCDAVGKCLKEALDGEYIEAEEESETSALTVVALYSPIGGAGTSTMALGLSRKLAKLEEKVLVIGCDDTQSMGALLNTRDTADDVLAEVLKSPTDETYWTILKNIVLEGTSCLLPFDKPLSLLNVGAKELLVILNVLEKKKDFSYVILDLGSTYNENTVQLMKRADYNIMVTEPVISSCRKLEKVLMNRQQMDYFPDYIISNQHHTDRIRLDSEYLFGSVADYASFEEAMEDPLFYSLALELTMELP